MSKTLKFLLFLLTTGVLINSCTDDADTIYVRNSKKPSAREVSTAREFFESNSPDLYFPDPSLVQGNPSTKAHDYGEPLKPQWGNSRIIKGDDYTSVQAALGDGLKHAAVKMIVNGADTTYEKTRWFSRLVV